MGIRVTSGWTDKSMQRVAVMYSVCGEKTLANIVFFFLLLGKYDMFPNAPLFKYSWFIGPQQAPLHVEVE